MIRTEPSLGSVRIAPAALTAVFLLAMGAMPAQAANVTFTDVTAPAGVSMRQTVLADSPGHPMHAGGVAGDFNNDGWPDIFVIGGGLTPDKLFINMQDGTFENQAPAWFGGSQNLPLLYRGVGANAGDYNNDGWLDIFVTSMGDLPGSPTGGQLRFYRNNGNGTFSNVAAAAHVNQGAPYPDGYGVTFGDYDLDGNLDLWIGGWHRDPNDFRLKGTRLFHNNGDGTLTDVSVISKMYDDTVHGFGAIFADMDGDRYPELLVAGDFGTSRYFTNNRKGAFTKINPLLPGDGPAWNGMGTTIADFDRDGMTDWYVGAIYPASLNQGPPGSRVYKNAGNNQFQTLPLSSGTQDLGWCWGVTSSDLDNDGWPDLVQTGGWPNCDPVTAECFHDPVFVLHNNHDQTFTDVHAASNLNLVTMGRGMMSLDYDRDGDMDIVILSNEGDLHMYRNDLIQAGQPTPSDAKWLEVYLDTHLYRGLAPNGLGSKVTVHETGSALTAQPRMMNGGSNFLSGSEQMAQFGLGSAGSADVTVEWPTGFRTVMTGVPANQRLTVVAQPPFRHGPILAGKPLDFVVKGLLPGEVATFAYSLTGQGAGPCPANLGGLCVDLLPPISTLGTAVADANGTATLTLTPAAVTKNVYSQAAVARGVGGKTSLKTNVIVDTP